MQNIDTIKQYSNIVFEVQNTATNLAYGYDVDPMEIRFNNFHIVQPSHIVLMSPQMNRRDRGSNLTWYSYPVPGQTPIEFSFEGARLVDSFEIVQFD